MIIPSVLSAQTVYTTANTAYPLENLGHSPRAYALGEAFSGISGDPECLFYNPAGLSGISSGFLSAVHQTWITAISQDTLLGALPTGKYGTFAMGLDYTNFGSLQGYDALGNPSAALQPWRGSLSLGWGGQILPRLAVGLATHDFMQNLVKGVTDFASAFQGGFLWNPSRKLSLGGSYTYYFTPTATDRGFLKFGGTWTQMLLSTNPTLLTMDFSLPLYNVARLQFGAEQPLSAVFTARLGYQWEVDNNFIGGFRGLTAGLGISLQDLKLDYSFSPNGDLGFSQLIGLTYRFPKESRGSPVANPPPAAKPLTPQVPSPLFVPRVSSPLVRPAPQTPNPLSIPNRIPPPPPTPTPVSDGSKPALNFNPSATVLPSDQVVRVETQFQIPDSTTAQSAPATLSAGLQKAIDDAGNKVQQNPQDAQAWMTLGNLYWKTGQPDYALQCFTEVLRLRPDSLALKAWINRYRQAHPNGPSSGE